MRTFPIHEVGVTGGALRVGHADEFDASALHLAANPPTRLVISHEGPEGHVDGEVTKVHGLAGTTRADRFVGASSEDGMRVGFREGVEVHHGVPGNTTQNEGLHRIGMARHLTPRYRRRSRAAATPDTVTRLSNQPPGPIPIPPDRDGTVGIDQS